MGKWRWAVLSDDQRFRYHLTRQWGDGAGNEAYSALVTENGRIERQVIPYAPRSIGWVMCNPSTADAVRDDPTILKLEKFAKLWGYDGIWVTNLWALRTPDVKHLQREGQQGLDIVGPGNDQALQAMLQHTRYTILAWGQIATKVSGYRDRVEYLKRVARDTPKVPTPHILGGSWAPSVSTRQHTPQEDFDWVTRMSLTCVVHTQNRTFGTLGYSLLSHSTTVRPHSNALYKMIENE